MIWTEPLAGGGPVDAPTDLPDELIFRIRVKPFDEKY
jgi:hypothetical protein